MGFSFLACFQATQKRAKNGLADRRRNPPKGAQGAYIRNAQRDARLCGFWQTCMGLAALRTEISLVQAPWGVIGQNSQLAHRGTSARFSCCPVPLLFIFVGIHPYDPTRGFHPLRTPKGILGMFELEKQIGFEL